MSENDTSTIGDEPGSTDQPTGGGSVLTGSAKRRGRRTPLAVARRQARRCAVQAIYQWQLTGDEPRLIQEQFKTRDGYSGCDAEYFLRLLEGVAIHAEALDQALKTHLDRSPEELDQVERAILRLTSFELLHCVDVPWRAAVNEAVELAKTFGATESHRYINNVLDALARVARPDELGSRQNKPPPEAS